MNLKDDHSRLNKCTIIFRNAPQCRSELVHPEEKLLKSLFLYRYAEIRYKNTYSYLPDKVLI